MADGEDRLKREEGPVRRRRRQGRVVPRQEAGGEADDRLGRRRRRGERQGERPRGERRGRADLRGDVSELQKGMMYAGIEGMAATVDVASSVLRGAVDRAFSRDYGGPGDVRRNGGRDADDAARDTLDRIRDIPQRTTDRFYEAVKPSRASSEGERSRRARAAAEEEGE